MRATTVGPGAVGAAALWFALGASVHAANTNKTRVAPAFWGEQCIVTVDRDEDPEAWIGLAIPFEDSNLTEDELPDSRRFQFFALCQDHPVEQDLPNWVSLEDAQRSLDMEIIGELPDDADVLETASEWDVPGHDGEDDSCIIAMNGPDERVPITCEATVDGFVWDTTGAPAGNYVVRSYTFEPEQNLWARRPGLVRVLDGADDPGPAVTITAPRRKGTSYEQPGIIVTGCAAGAEGSTITLEFAEAAAVAEGDDSAWRVAQEFTLEDEWEVLFVPPQDTVYKALYLRATATDPSGRTWVAHADHEIVVLPDCGEAQGSEPASIADGCGAVPQDYLPPGPLVEQPRECDFDPGDDDDDDDDADTGGEDVGEDAGEGSSDDGEADGGNADGGDGGDDGCGCRSATPAPTGVAMLLMIGLGLATARRRQ